jgi:hypothetical protein
MKPAAVRRPLTLAEVAEESVHYADFGRNLRDFLHELAQARRQERLVEPMLAAEPVRLRDRFAEGSVCDAFLAATADHLARANGFQPPAWTLNPERALEKPWFSELFPSVRLLLLRDTPSAFKERNVFVFASALEAA